MKDIDFDELDRAVSSVLGQGPVKQEPDAAAAAEADTPTDDNQDSSRVTVSSGDTTQSEAAPEVSTSAPVAVTTPSLAVKRRGKFMDVMHPSADMAPAAQPVRPVSQVSPLTPLVESEKTDTTEADAPVETTGGLEANPHEPTASLDETTVPVGAEPAPIEALLPDHVQDAKKHDETSAPEPADESAADVSVADEATKTEEPPVSMYVDPLSANEETKEPTSDEADATEPESLGADEAETVDSSMSASDSESSQEAITEQTTTPFLSDTNVDKRPLGAFVGQEQATASAEAPLQPAMAMPGDRQSAPAVPLPRELQPDVVEVESVQEPEVAAAPAAADDGRVEGHPLFDTSTYHEPIAAVHSNGMAAWLKWLIGLLLCLVVGAGVGYFLFAAGL